MVSYVLRMFDYVYVNRQTFVRVFYYMPAWEKVHLKLEKNLWYSSLFSLIFYENINQEHTLLPDCAFSRFTYVCCENFMSDFLTCSLSKSGNILFG